MLVNACPTKCNGQWLSYVCTCGSVRRKTHVRAREHACAHFIVRIKIRRTQDEEMRRTRAYFRGDLPTKTGPRQTFKADSTRRDN